MTNEKQLQTVSGDQNAGMQLFEVRAYSKTGIYSEIVSAINEASAKVSGLNKIKAYAFGRILSAFVTEAV